MIHIVRNFKQQSTSITQKHFLSFSSSIRQFNKQAKHEKRVTIIITANFKAHYCRLAKIVTANAKLANTKTTQQTSISTGCAKKMFIMIIQQKYFILFTVILIQAGIHIS